MCRHDDAQADAAHSRILQRAGQDLVVTRGRTIDNAAHLAPSFIATIVARYQGTRLGRQEIDAELSRGCAGRTVVARNDRATRRISAVPEFERIIVAIDPAVTSNEDSDESGIIVAGRDSNGHAYVLADLSGPLPTA